MKKNSEPIIWGKKENITSKNYKIPVKDFYGNIISYKYPNQETKKPARKLKSAIDDPVGKWSL